MSEYRPSYVSPPRDSAAYRSDRTLTKGLGSHNYSTTDLSYEDLKYEYSKVLNHLDSIRQDRNLYKNPLESVSGTKGYSKLLSPSTSERSPYRSTGKITTTTYSRFVEPEKRVIELEQEVSELKKLLESYKLRITTLQRENHDYQERIKDFKKIDHCNKQLGFEMKTLDHEILAITKQMRELEQENARLIAEKNSGETSTTTQNKELPKNLKKYVKYIYHLLTTLNDDHFGRFCFEERFTSEEELNKVVEAKDSDKLVMQSFRYIADLLLNISSTAKSSTESAIIRPQKEGQAYLVDLNETYLSVPRVRATTPEVIKDLVQPRKKSPEVRRAYSKAALTDLDQRENDTSIRKTEEERRYSERPEEGAKKQQYGDDRKFEERRRQYEDTRVKPGGENDERRPSAKEKVQEKMDERQYANESRGLQRDTSQYIRESENYLEKGQRQSLAQTQSQSQRNTNKEEYSYKEPNEGLNRQERRYTETDNRQYSSKRDEEPTYKRDDRRNENVQERYTKQVEQAPLERPQERQYLTKEEAYPARRIQREENRSRPTSPERQPTPEMRYSEHSRTEPDHQIYDDDYYSRRIATEEAPASSYYGDLPAAPARAHSKSPNSRSDKRPPTNRESSPKIQYQSQGYHSNQQSRPAEEHYQSNKSLREPEDYEDRGNRRGQQYEIAPKPSMAAHNFSSVNQPETRQPELVRKPSNLSESGYQKTGKTEHSFDMVDQEYREAPKLTKKQSSDRQELQHKGSMPTLSLVQRRESKQEKARTPRQDLVQKQPTISVNTASASQFKSPNKDIKKSNSMMDPSSQGKRKSSPGRLTPMSAQNQQSGQKMLSPNSGQVSQIVYKSSKSLQGGYSPISSNKSSKPEINPASIQLTTEEKDLIERENELIQRIRELREKEKELMEKEREISQKTDAQFRSQPRPSGDAGQSVQQAKYKEQRQASFKEPSPTDRPPRMDLKKTGKSTPQGGNFTNTIQRENSNERFYEDAGEPRGERPVAARHDSLSPRNRQDEGRSPGLKSILKNSETGYQGQLNETKYSNNPSSPFRSSFDDPNANFDGYSTVQSNDRRNQYASVPENYQKRQYQDEGQSAGSETNHQKRLTFGNNANFEPEFTGSRNYSYVSERRDDPSPDNNQVSPNKRDQGTHYASFKVSFGRTESRFKKSPSPEPNIPSIFDVPRRKRVSPSPSKYDVKQAIEYRDLNASGKKEQDADASGRKSSSVLIRDVLESQREGEENERELPKTPEKKGNAGHKLKSILVEQKWEIVKD